MYTSVCVLSQSVSNGLSSSDEEPLAHIVADTKRTGQRTSSLSSSLSSAVNDGSDDDAGEPAKVCYILVVIMSDLELRPWFLLRSSRQHLN